MQIAYLVHDLNDAAVRRRVALFEVGGFAVALAGFHRDDRVPDRVGSAPVTSLGRTRDGALLQRIVSVLRHVAFPGKLRAQVRDAKVIVARNLETLVLARRLRRDDQRLVYECLDIHRLLLGDGTASRWLHKLEGWALSGVDLVVVSAPAFRDAYFRRHIGYDGTVFLVENLVPRGRDMPAVVEPPRGGPWVIGWFGMLRCKRSFAILRQLAAASDGRIEVVIAGRPSPDLFPDFEREAAEAPGVTFLGGYTAESLPALLGRMHFVWAIDYFEEGLNSVWLLPNRLYESIAHGGVPLALRSVATGDWLEAHGVGVVLDDPAAELPALLETLTQDEYQAMRKAVAEVPADAVTMDDAQTRAVARTIAGMA